MDKGQRNEWTPGPGDRPLSPNAAGIYSRIFNLDHYCHEGLMARTVADCALLENVIAGPDPSDVASIRPKLVIPADLGLAAARLPVALSTDLGCYRAGADVVASHPGRGRPATRHGRDHLPDVRGPGAARHLRSRRPGRDQRRADRALDGRQDDAAVQHLLPTR
jgi:hypothetical protein